MSTQTKFKKLKLTFQFWQRGFWLILVRHCPKSIIKNNGNITISYFVPFYNFKILNGTISEEDKILLLSSDKTNLKVSKKAFKKLDL